MPIQALAPADGRRRADPGPHGLRRPTGQKGRVGAEPFHLVGMLEGMAPDIRAEEEDAKDAG